MLFSAAQMYAQSNRIRGFFFKTGAALLLCAACLLAGPGLERAGAENADAGAEAVYAPGNSRLTLPENWNPSGPWAKDPAAGEQAGGVLFSAQALAPTGEEVTNLTVYRLPAIKIPAEALPQMSEKEQRQFCDSLLKSFVVAFTDKTKVAPVGSKAMIKRLGDWYTIMLTSRFVKGDMDIIINQVSYSLPDGLLSLTFYTQTPLISVMASDMTYILDNFQPDVRLVPRKLPPRADNESLDAYLDRIAAP